MKLKKVLSLTLALVMSLAMAVPAAAAAAEDAYVTHNVYTASNKCVGAWGGAPWNSDNYEDPPLYQYPLGTVLTIKDSGYYWGSDTDYEIKKLVIDSTWIMDLTLFDSYQANAYPVRYQGIADGSTPVRPDPDFQTRNDMLFKYKGSGGAVTIPDGITIIQARAFEGCTGLTSVTIPAGVTKIEYAVFYGCPNLSDIYYGGTEAQWKAIEIDNNNNFLTQAAIHYSSTAPTEPTEPTTPVEPEQPASAFTDVPSGEFYAAPVQWAVEKGITAGTSKTKFSPASKCNRAQILAFLWRASGSPEPTAANPFSDIKESDFYYKAALWAAEKGIVSGTTFDALTPCTRASTMEYMWKAAGSPAATYDGRFNDVAAGSDYAQAVAWALEHNVTAGTSATKFSPNSTCTRGQIVTFLYRAFAE